MIEDIIFYDSDFLLNFLVIDEISFLKKFFKKIILPEPVFNELTYKETITKEKIINVEKIGFIKVAIIDIFHKSIQLLNVLKKDFGMKQIKELEMVNLQLLL